VTAIGGIDEGNVDEVVAAGFRSVAVIRAIAAADDPRRAAGLLSGAVGQAE
jgi:thiamine-phosphate pyrophosphorylase